VCMFVYVYIYICICIYMKSESCYKIFKGRAHRCIYIYIYIYYTYACLVMFNSYIVHFDQFAYFSVK